MQTYTTTPTRNRVTAAEALRLNRMEWLYCPDRREALEHLRRVLTNDTVSHSTTTFDFVKLHSGSYIFRIVRGVKLFYSALDIPYHSLRDATDSLIGLLRAVDYTDLNSLSEPDANEWEERDWEMVQQVRTQARKYRRETRRYSLNPTADTTLTTETKGGC